MMEKSEPGNKNNSDQSEAYAHGYESALTQKLHVSRTANKQASWFLPYLQSGMSLLDCGCATGSITVGLAAVVAPGQVTGIDISAIEIQRAGARAAEAGMRNVSFAVGNIYQLDFPDNSFDALFCHNVLEHLAEPDRALKEMQRVLKLGGVIGLRDTDMGGVLLTPTNDLIDRFVAVLRPIGQQPTGIHGWDDSLTDCWLRADLWMSKHPLPMRFTVTLRADAS